MRCVPVSTGDEYLIGGSTSCPTSLRASAQASELGGDLRVGLEDVESIDPQRAMGAIGSAGRRPASETDSAQSRSRQGRTASGHSPMLSVPGV